MNDPDSHQETLHFWRSQIARMKKFAGKLLNGKPEEVAWNEVALCAEMERNLNDAINEIDRLTRRLYEMTAMRDALTVACGDKVGEIERLQALLDARQPYYCQNCSCPRCGNTRPAQKTPQLSGQSMGHGHVWPRLDGMKARCGGPALCLVCRREAAFIEALHDH